MTDARDEGGDTDDADENADHDHGVGRTAVTTRTTRHEIGVVVVETALHFFKEPLLLLGKWHFCYLTLLRCRSTTTAQ